MLFNSLDFLVFALVFFVIFYNFVKIRIPLALIASYFFYGYWNYYYLILILVSSLIDFYVAQQIEINSDKKRKMYLLISIVSNLGILMFFKYHNFFADQMSLVNLSIPKHDFLLPVGISFYTFQTMSYSIDVYRGDIKAEGSFLKFCLYVSYWPQLVAGPIERASHLLPQLSFNKKVDKNGFMFATYKILTGYFKKVVIADKAAIIVNVIFDNPGDFSSLFVFTGVVLFAIQIYCDFSGYSDIAIGFARLMGVELNENFKMPYFSFSITEFWRRWHISLSTWFRDYLYIPLGGSRVLALKTFRNLWVTFFISGLWHGAKWNFVIWGALHGIFITIEHISKNYLKLNLPFPKIVKYLWTMLIVLFCWIFFRASDFDNAIDVIKNIFELRFGGSIVEKHRVNELIYLCLLLFVWDYLNYKKIYLFKEKIYFPIIIVTFLLTLLYGEFAEKGKFLYFQF